MTKRKRETNDEKWPRVTDIASIAEDKSGLMYWYGKYGTQECTRIKQESAKFGSNVHKLVEQVLKKEALTIPPGANREGDCANMIMQWCSEAKVKPVELEIEVKSMIHKFVGHPDAIVTFGDDDRLWLLDWKSSSKIGDSYALQLAGYAIAYEEMTDKRIEDGAIIRVAKDPNADPQFETREYHNLLTDYGPLFLYCRELWDFYHHRGKWKK